MTTSLKSVALGIVEWCPPCSAPHFLDSCAVYQHQYLGLHSDHMVEPASDPNFDLIMVNFWLLGYAREQANCVQTRVNSLIISQQP